jgi:hypothetical protein
VDHARFPKNPMTPDGALPLTTDHFCYKNIVRNFAAVLAQLVEHITRNDEVVGSIPTNGSKSMRNPLIIGGFFLFEFSVLLGCYCFCNRQGNTIMLLQRGKVYYFI